MKGRNPAAYWLAKPRKSADHNTVDSLKTITQKMQADDLPETGFTAKIGLEGLLAGQEIFNRIAMLSHAGLLIIGEPPIGGLRTARAEKRSISSCWPGDKFAADLAAA